MSEGKDHLSIVICGHVDSGKSTTTGRLIFELGGIPERELDKLKEEAAALGKSSFAFAFYMDRAKEERERGVTIACTTKEFFTAMWHYTIIDAPGTLIITRPLLVARGPGGVKELAGSRHHVMVVGNREHLATPSERRQQRRHPPHTHTFPTRKGDSIAQCAMNLADLDTICNRQTLWP